MDETPSASEPGRLPLAIESVRWDRAGEGIVLRVAGQWTIEPPAGLPAPAVLLGDPEDPVRIEALGDTSQASARAAKGAKPFRAAFALEAAHAPLLGEPVRLDLGFGFMPLPDPEAPDGEKTPPRKVVDSSEMAERRARRAEEAHQSTAQRAEAAEAAVEALELELARMEVRLRDRAEEPSAPAQAPASFGQDLSELRELVQRAERAASATATRDGGRASALARESELADAAAMPPQTRPAPAPPSAPAGPLTAELLEAERRQREARSRPAPASPPDVAELEAELERRREDGRRLAASVRAGALELRDALLTLTAERDEARRQVERLQAELERARRSAEARERAWDAATELAREAVAAASRAVDESEARAGRLEEDLAKGARALERAEALIGDLRGRQSSAAADAAPARAPAPEVGAPWLGRALTDLRRSDENAAMDLLLGLLTAQGARREIPESFDVHVPGREPLRYVPRAQGPATLRPLTAAEKPARVRLEANSHHLQLLLTGEGRRRPRVRGPFRARRALRKALGPVPLDVAELADAGILPPPRALYAALVQRIHPAWLADYDFVVEQDIEGPGADRWFVVVSGGRLELSDELPGERRGPDAIVRASQRAFAHVLSGKAPPEGEKVTLRGDRIALALLTQWTERARQR
jgi:hypothetical protein